MTYFWAGTLVAGIVFQVLVISSLLRGSYRKFPFLFVYLLAGLFTSVAGSAVYFNRALRADYARQYWIGEVVEQFLVFCLVISLVFQVVRNRAHLLAWLPLGLFAVGAVSYYRTPHGHFGLWMTELSRNLSFCAVLLNLILWMALIRHKPEDPRLLLISGGLGLQMAGRAIGHSLRQMAKIMITPGNLIIVLSALLCEFIWWQTFRQSPHFDPAKTEE